MNHLLVCALMMILLSSKDYGAVDTCKSVEVIRGTFLAIAWSAFRKYCERNTNN